MIFGGVNHDWSHNHSLAKQYSLQKTMHENGDDRWVPIKAFWFPVVVIKMWRKIGTFCYNAEETREAWEWLSDRSLTKMNQQHCCVMLEGRNVKKEMIINHHTPLFLKKKSSDPSLRLKPKATVTWWSHLFTHSLYKIAASIDDFSLG